jgi:hypothetical protein
MNRNRLVRALHPPFSPSRAPSDFSRFDKVETAVMGRTFNDETWLFRCVTDVLNALSPGELEAAFGK